MKKILLLIILAFTITFCGCWSEKTFEGNPLIVDYLDVGHGDCSVIKLPTDEYMMIDCGEADKCSTIDSFLKDNGIKKIDYLILTHPHSDHIGSAAKIISKYDIGKIYMPRVKHVTKTYETLLETIKNKGLKVSTAKAGVSILENDDLKMSFLAPNNDEYEEINNYSAVLKLTYKNTTFLFMGDAQKESENEILLKSDVKADVLKVGHHGSNTSTSKKFLDAVNPEIAVVSTDGKSYNLPSKKVIKRLENSGCEVFRTDTEGNIIIQSDGKKVMKEVRF